MDGEKVHQNSLKDENGVFKNRYLQIHIALLKLNNSILRLQRNMARRKLAQKTPNMPKTKDLSIKGTSE